MKEYLERAYDYVDDHIEGIFISGCALLIVIILVYSKDELFTPRTYRVINKDSMQVWIDKDSLTQYKIKSLVTENAKSFLEIEIRDKEIKNLQSLVSKYKKELKQGGSMTAFKSEGRYEVRTKTEIITDTVLRKGDSIFIYPKYFSDFNLNGWIKGSVVGAFDSVRVWATVKNEYEVLLVPEYKGWFRKQKAYVQIADKNPYAEIKSINSYQVELPKERKWGIGVFAGYGLTSYGFTPMIGTGITYTIIKF